LTVRTWKIKVNCLEYISNRFNNLRILIKFAVACFKKEGILNLLRELRIRLIWIQKVIVLEKSLQDPVPNLRSSVPIEIAKATLQDIQEGTDNGLKELVGEDGLFRFQYRLSKGHECFLAFQRGKVVHYSWVCYRGKRLKLAGLRNGSPFIYDCLTSKNVRGKGIFPCILAFICNYLKNANNAKVTTDTNPNNIPSLKGIKKVGFKERKFTSFFGFLGYCIFKRIKVLDQEN